MALMYDMNTINETMIRAAEVCRQDMPEGEKVNAVLACFAAMKPVEAEPVVRCKDCKHRGKLAMCPLCWSEWVETDNGGYYERYDETNDYGFCEKGKRQEAET